MDNNLISLFFPTAPSTTAKAGASETAPPKQFSPEFFELLQGDISALTAPGNGAITTADINNLSDTQIEMLGNFLSNVDVGENGEMMFSHPDVESFTNPSNISSTAAALENSDIHGMPPSNRPEHDPAVLDVLGQIPAISASSSKSQADALQKLGSFMEQLLSGLPQESRAGSLSVSTAGNSGLETNKTASAASNAALIATGLSPEEMMGFLNNISQAESKADAAKEKEKGHDENITNILFALIAPAQTATTAGLPAAEEQNVIFLPRGIMVSATASSKSEGEKSLDNKGINIAGEANAGSKSGENVARALNKALQSLVSQGSMNGFFGNTDAAAEAEGGFDKILGMFEQPAADRAGSTRLPEGVDKSLNASLTHAEAKALADVKMSAGLSTIPTDNAPTGQNVSASSAWDKVFPDGINWSTAPGAQQTANNSVALGTMTSLSSQSNAATAAHPTTQMVAATITKAGQSDNKNITLRLDPPDLGKVHVKLEMSEDNIIKAIITSEKPQTHMMLQRDAHVLEKALQDAGLDANGGNLEFTLSQDGSLFGDNNGRGGENDSGGGSNGSHAGGNTDNGEIIESRMTWNVDPESGYMHYNLVV